MMSDETNNPLYLGLIRGRFNKRAFYRRRRKHVGKDWKPDQPEENIHARGVWCPRCGKSHPYNGHGKLVAQFERRSDGRWVILWLCPISGDVIGDTDRLRVVKQAETETGGPASA